MKRIAFAFAILVALAPTAAAGDCQTQHDVPEPEDEPCKFLTPTLVPPDYVRIDPDCPPLGP